MNFTKKSTVNHPRICVNKPQPCYAVAYKRVLSIRRAVQDATSIKLPLASTPLITEKTGSTCPQASGYETLPLNAWSSDELLMSCVEANGPRLRVALLLSGGVDSSVAAALACAAGHQVTAFYLQIWFVEDFRNFWGQCPWEEDLKYAREVCERLQIPLEVVPLSSMYWDRVVAHSVDEIRAGRTPNPDMLCNSRVKFGAFHEFLEEHYPGQFDRIASGHYARLIRPGAMTNYTDRSAAVPQFNSTERTEDKEAGFPINGPVQHTPHLVDEALPSSAISTSTLNPSCTEPNNGAFTPRTSSTLYTSSPSDDRTNLSTVDTSSMSHTTDGVERSVHMGSTLDSSNGNSSGIDLASSGAIIHHSADLEGTIPGESMSDSCKGRDSTSPGNASSISHSNAGSSSGTEERTPSQHDNSNDASTSSRHSGSFHSDDSGLPEDTGVRLAMTQDAVKDQTYFLAQLSRAQIARAMFPLGPLTKAQVRALAWGADLATKGRKDSQGVCFLGKVKFSEFVKEHLGEQSGSLVEEETGKVLGTHQGYWFHTIGQRGGLRLNGGPWYVVRKDIHLNAVYVSKQYYDPSRSRSLFRAGPFNWLTPEVPQNESGLKVKVRHGPNMYSVKRFALDKDGMQAIISIDGNDQGLAAGQYVVIYRDSIVLGSGMIQHCLNDW